jgi:hypothetical protein
MIMSDWEIGKRALGFWFVMASGFAVGSVLPTFFAIPVLVAAMAFAIRVLAKGW